MLSIVLDPNADPDKHTGSENSKDLLIRQSTRSKQRTTTKLNETGW